MFVPLVGLIARQRDCEENMELKHFPLDRQLLQFAITASVPSSIMVLEVG